MDTFLIILYFLLFLGLIIFISKKIEDHFSYYKILHPDKFGKYNSYIHMQSKMVFKYQDYRFMMFIPYFFGRRRDLEENNHQLKRLGNKINKSCNIIYILLIFIVILSFIVPGKQINKNNSLSDSNEYFNDLQNDTIFAKIIENEILLKLNKDLETKTIDFDTLTHFDWDNMVILPPYSIPDSVGKRLGFSGKVLEKTGINYRDEINVLVFLNIDKVVRIVEYPRFPGDFSENEIIRIRRENAKFEIIETNQKNVLGDTWILVNLITSNSP